MLELQHLGDGRVLVIFQRMADVGRVAQLFEIVAQAHAFDESQRELRLFAAFQQFKHFTHRHTRRKAIGPRFKMRKLRLKTQQPLEYSWAVNDFIAIKLIAQRQAPGTRF